jgi:hypothetical protein
MVKNDPKYSHRAKEGYYVPYYYTKPALAVWNHLTVDYLGKKQGFPRPIKFMLEHKLYFLLKLTVNIKSAMGSLAKRGIIGTLKRVYQPIASVKKGWKVAV